MLIRILLVMTMCYCASIPVRADEVTTFKANTLSSPPYIYKDGGQVTGIAVDIVNEAFHRIGGYKVKYTLLPWRRAVKRTKEGEVDLLLYASHSEQREAWGRYVDSVLINTSFKLFKRADATIQLNPDFNEVSHLSIAVRGGYIYQPGEFLRAVQNNQFRDVIYSDSTEQSIELLLRGRIDLFIGDELPVVFFLKQRQLQKVVDTVKLNGEALEVFSVPTYILLSKQNTDVELSGQLSDALNGMRSDGTYQNIYDRYHE